MALILKEFLQERIGIKPEAAALVTLTKPN